MRYLGGDHRYGPRWGQTLGRDTGLIQLSAKVKGDLELASIAPRAVGSTLFYFTATKYFTSNGKQQVLILELRLSSDLLIDSFNQASIS